MAGAATYYIIRERGGEKVFPPKSPDRIDRVEPATGRARIFYSIRSARIFLTYWAEAHETRDAGAFVIVPVKLTPDPGGVL
jgi:hypothetical protein